MHPIFKYIWTKCWMKLSLKKVRSYLAETQIIVYISNVFSQYNDEIIKTHVGYSEAQNDA